MSIEVTVEVPLEIALIIRELNYELEQANSDVEFTLATITNDIIRAIQTLPSDSIPRPMSRLSSSTISHDTDSTASSSDWLGARSCSSASATSSVSSAISSISTDSRLGVHMYPEFSLIVENEYGYNHRTQATGDMTIADLEASLGPLCGFEPTWQSLTWHGYRVNQPNATLFSYGIDRYPYLEIRRRSPPAFDEQTLVILKEPKRPARALPATPPPLPPR